MAWKIGNGGKHHEAARHGACFALTNDVINAVDKIWFGQLAYDETTPILLIRNPARAWGGADALTVEVYLVIEELSVSLTNTPGAPVEFLLVGDACDRYEPFSGVARTPVNTHVGALNEGAQVAAAFIYDEDPEAIASALVTGSSPRQLDIGGLPAAPGNSGAFEIDGAIILAPGSCLMAYAWAPITEPQGRYSAKAYVEYRQT